MRVMLQEIRKSWVSTTLIINFSLAPTTKRVAITVMGIEKARN